MSGEDEIKSDGVTIDDEVKSSLRMAGVSFSIILICTVIGPITKLMTTDYGTFVASIFSVSTIIAFPLEAIYSRIKHKLYSIQSNLFIVLFISLFTFILFESGSEIFVKKFIGFIFGIPITISIIITYLLLHEYVPQIISRNTIKDKFFYLVYVSIPTIVIFTVTFLILHYFFGITMGFDELGKLFGV